MKKSFLLYTSLSFILIINITSLYSCSKYTITTTQKNPSDIVYKKFHGASYFWGIINKPPTIVDTTCGKAGLSEVKVTTNFGYSLIHVVTLGIVHLVTIECKCQKEPPIIGEQP